MASSEFAGNNEDPTVLPEEPSGNGSRSRVPRCPAGDPEVSHPGPQDTRTILRTGIRNLAGGKFQCAASQAGGALVQPNRCTPRRIPAGLGARKIQTVSIPLIITNSCPIRAPWNLHSGELQATDVHRFMSKKPNKQYSRYYNKLMPNLGTRNLAWMQDTWHTHCF